MQDAVTDTHNLIWYLQDSPKLTATVCRYFDGCDSGEICIYIPTICLVEIIYLEEKWQIPSDTLESLATILEQGQSNFQLAALDTAVVSALRQIPRKTVPDMPDRIIAATALALSLPLLSRDGKIKLSAVKTVW